MMESTMDSPRGAIEKRSGILYPMMLIAAITVIVFSVAGIATMMGWLPGAQSQIRLESNEPPVRHAAVDSTRAKVPAPAAVCVDECGVVESIRAVEVKGEGSGLGAVGGAVVGGILGNQVGRGSGRSAATVVGAGAGAYAGHEIEKNTRKSVSYQIRVRMNDGTTRTFFERAQPALAIGQKVRVTGQSVNAAG